MNYIHNDKVKLKRNKIKEDCYKQKYLPENSSEWDEISDFIDFIEDNEIEYLTVNEQGTKLISLTAESLHEFETICIPDKYVKPYFKNRKEISIDIKTPKFKVGDVVYAKYYDEYVKFQVKTVGMIEYRESIYFVRNAKDDINCTFYEDMLFSEKEMEELNNKVKEETSSPKFKVGDVAYIDTHSIKGSYKFDETYIQCSILEYTEPGICKIKIEDVMRTHVFNETDLLNEEEYKREMNYIREDEIKYIINTLEDLKKRIKCL